MHILLTVIAIIYYSIIIIQLFNLKYKRQLSGCKILLLGLSRNRPQTLRLQRYTIETRGGFARTQ